MAELAGVPRSAVERIEAGTRQPSLVTLTELLAGVDLSFRIRVDEYDDRPPRDVEVDGQPPLEGAAASGRAAATA
jgi:transcriptional regulator with XRE-family HTH domain